MSNISTGKTLRRLREAANLRVGAVGEAIARQGKTVNAWENGRGEPDIDALITLSKMFGVKNILAEIAYDRYGSDSPLDFDLTAEEQKLILRFRDLDDFGKRAVRRVTDNESERVSILRGSVPYINTLRENHTYESTKNESTKNESAASEKKSRENAAETTRAIPLVKHPFFPENNIDEAQIYETAEFVRVRESSANNEADFAVRIDGAGFEPRFSHGDILLIKRQDNLQIGDIGLVSVDGRILIRGNAHNRLISVSPGVDDIPLDGSHTVRFIGKIIAKA